MRTMEPSDEDIVDISKDFIDCLKVGYREFGTISLSGIDVIANHIFVHYIQFDTEFKTICYEWEYRHRQSTDTEFLERYVR